MSNREDLKQWIRKLLLGLPVTRASYFISLWRKGNLHVPDEYQLDELDRTASKLAVSAVDTNVFTLFCLPDANIARRAAIFSTILTKLARATAGRIGSHGRNKRMIYFGTTVKFKHAINATYIDDFSLSDAFLYTRAISKVSNSKKGATGAGNSQFFPEVICVYNPDSPEKSIYEFKPHVVFIDCGREQELKWLRALLTVCRDSQIPVVGWELDPFSSHAEIFESFGGSVVYFPNNDPTNKDRTLADLYLDQTIYEILPVVLGGPDCDILNEEIFQQKKILTELTRSVQSSIHANSVKVFWKTLRLLESIPIPVEVYNAEAKSFWGIYSLTEYFIALEKGLQASQVGGGRWNELSIKALTKLKEIYQKVRDSTPLWNYLSNLCMDRSEIDHLRVVTFPNKSQKQLFSYMLISRLDITEEELLNDSRILLRTLKEFANPSEDDRQIFTKHTIDPIIVGFPGQYDKDAFSKTLRFNPKILLFKHQLSSLKSILNEFNRVEKDHLKKTVKSLKRISGLNTEVNVPARIDSYKISDYFEEIQLEKIGVKGSTKSPINSLTNIGNLESELGQLFDTDIDQPDEVLSKVDITDSTDKERQVFVENGFEIVFEEGFKLRVSDDDKVNIVKQAGIDKVFVRSVKHGDRLLVVHNSSRESLYDLIISRIHTHPSLEIHMTVLRRWREEFVKKYLFWKNKMSGRNLSEFLSILQDKGSDITTTLAVCNWLDGTTLRPYDKMDILRVGEILDISFVKDNYTRIAKAASRIAGIHIALSRKLNTWLQGGLGSNAIDDLEILDKETGLMVGDLKSSIRIFTVQSINEINESVLVKEIGILEKN
ncbi:MAG: hypothetical protein HYZ15_04635 [Sphingobacteriales bacterium]|nr:hypothetical protein [Sphingobacteriales bacterium]